METLYSSGAFGAPFVFASYVLLAEIVCNCMFYLKSLRLSLIGLRLFFVQIRRNESFYTSVVNVCYVCI